MKKQTKYLIYLVVAILLIILVYFLYQYNIMIQFMGGFFVIVSILKLLDWKGFIHAFSMYDLLASRSKIYASVYPLIELGIGIAFLTNFYIKIFAAITFVIMTVGAIGVGKNLFGKAKVKCACLGTLIKIPLTEFTLFEDVLMAAMALMILIL